MDGADVPPPEAEGDDGAEVTDQCGGGKPAGAGGEGVPPKVSSGSE